MFETEVVGGTVRMLAGDDRIGLPCSVPSYFVGVDTGPPTRRFLKLSRLSSLGMVAGG
jgi:hypothetical protein